MSAPNISALFLYYDNINHRYSTHIEVKMTCNLKRILKYILSSIHPTVSQKIRLEDLMCKQVTTIFCYISIYAGGFRVKTKIYFM